MEIDRLDSKSKENISNLIKKIKESMIAVCLLVPVFQNKQITLHGEIYSMD